MIKTGIRGHRETVVTQEMTARAVGSGLLDVYATPCMAALMEETAHTSVGAELMDGEGTVGTAMDIRHLAATPVGMRVSCDSELTEVQGRRLVFRVRAFDEAGLIGEGRHERFIINSAAFLAKAKDKLGLDQR